MTHNSSYLPTPAEIRLIQELAPGWEDVWNKILTELQGWENDGRLVLAVRASGVLRGTPGRIDEFVSSIYDYFYDQVAKKRLFAKEKYDPEKGDVYAWLCNTNNIRHLFREIRKSEIEKTILSRLNVPIEKARANKEKEAGLNNEKKSEEVNVGPDDFQVSRLLPESIQRRLETLCSRLCDENSSLRFSVEKGKIRRTTEQAGLQLYLRIDRSDGMILKLLGHVHSTVSKARAQTDHRDAPEIIEGEHRKAGERIRAKIDGYSNGLYDVARKAYRRIRGKTEKKLQRKTSEAALELCFFPLDAEQLKRLLNIQRDNADQILKRYRAELSRFLPLDEEEILLLDSLDIYNDDGDDTHE